MKKAEYVPCKECIECEIHIKGNEHHFHCTMQGQTAYPMLKAMIGNCPRRKIM